ncbi:cytosine deaminase [Dietzia natronolimnaea]|uniref:Cytosine deaminase n=1 Tax=Dietzia natronolimnaea TaxID=161920 RepID=A0A2A2WQD4_9ACTN|nr:amidohydrolase family protein [Dietzia natronolimnaea]PAY23253.1 cytosine deaminase [Dietzia natronolimnaea]
MDTLTRQRGDGAPSRGTLDARPDGPAARAHTTVPRQVDRITGVGLPDGRVVDVDIEGGVVVAVTEVGGAGLPDLANPGPAVIDGRGYLALTAPAEPHAHLDKALSWGATRPPGCDLGAAIDAWRAFSVTVDEDEIHERALAAARRLVASGTTAVRTHVDLHDDGDPLRGIRALVRVRDELADQVDLQIAAMVGDEDPADRVRAALEAGADLIGGAPHIAPDSIAETHRLIDLAEELGVGVDLHVDEFLDGDHAMLTTFTDRVASWEPGRIRTAGHCCRIGAMDALGQASAAEALCEAGVGVVTLPITNLYLQGRAECTSTPRGLPPVQGLLDGGVTVGAGADNVRDPFNPVGRSDAVETAMLLVVAAHLDMDTAWHLVTDGARDVMGLPPAGPVPGHRADLLLVRAGGLDDVIADAPVDRIVLRAGRVVSATASVVVDPFLTQAHSPDLQEAP